MGEYITVGESLLVTVFSMVIVFVVLIAISYLIDLLKVAINSKDKEQSENIIIEKPENIEETKIEEELNDEELVAVIAAAISVSMGVAIPEINIKSIKRVSSTAPIWAETGRKEYISGKL